MAQILLGAPIREKIKEELVKKIKKLKKRPVLAVVQVGDREDSNIYIKQKQKFGEEIGTIVKIFNFQFSIFNSEAEKELIEKIRELDNDESIDGIIVQLPLPDGFDPGKILNSISKEKDADGLGFPSRDQGEGGRRPGGVVPATARGVLALLDFYKIEIAGKKVAVVGQGILAGKPIADELEKRGAEVLRCDIHTKNIPEIARECDILVSAVGKRNLITKEFTNPGQVVVDVGNDVNFAEVEPIVSAITPVPGGAGPLTVACLFQNLLDLI